MTAQREVWVQRTQKTRGGDKEAAEWPQQGSLHCTGTSQPGPSPPTSDAIGEEVQAGLSSVLHNLGQEELDNILDTICIKVSL